MQLDRSIFKTAVNCLGIRVENKDVNLLRKIFCKQLFPQYRNVLSDDENHKIILLTPQVNESEIVSQLLLNFSPRPSEILKDQKVELNYEHLKAEEVLRKILPSHVEVPVGFETVGHLAHVNLRPEHDPYKFIIGQVWLDKHPQLRTVVNKTGKIQNQFRTFPMEVLAGETNFLVSVRNNGLRFDFDYSKVYWNSKLSEEHDRLCEKEFHSGDVLLDAFCGVGPFAIRAAKRKLQVWANDLNPDSVNSLIQNAKLNKIEIGDGVDGKLQTFNLDAREFLLTTLNKIKPQNCLVHVVMNLPETSISFIDAIVATFPVRVHCYCFSGRQTVLLRQTEVKERIEHVLGRPLSTIQIYAVRDVAPNKYMMRASFLLSPLKQEEEHETKKIKLIE